MRGDSARGAFQWPWHTIQTSGAVSLGAWSKGLSNGTLEAARAYLENDAPSIGPLLRGSRKDGKLTTAGISTRRLTQRVKVLGERIGIRGLSAHDCRHYAATRQASKGVRHLMDMFGPSR